MKHDRERLREALDELADVGDIIELAGGRWLAAFTRQVALGTETDDRLVVGGVPTSLLPTEQRGLLVHRGALRVTRGDAFGSALSLVDETLESWLGDSPADLEQWARSLLAQELDSYSPEEGARFRVYVPALARQREPQGFRWREQLGQLDGRFFADRELAFGVRQSRIVEIRDGRIIASGVPSLGGGDRRRLLYALDALARNPTRITVRTASSLSLVLQSEVPRAERRVFAALGELSVPEEKYYPRTWTFRIEHKRTILARLSALRVDLTHETK